MKKIGIVTLFGYSNYGNRLQMYATQRVYKRLGFDSEVLKYKVEQKKDSILIRIKVSVYFCLNLYSNCKTLFLKRKRICNFKNHSNNHISESRRYLNPLSLKNDFHEEYSFLSVGSDQVWGWFVHSISDFVFLKFAPKEKRIAFSPSFGSDTLENDYYGIYSEGLKGFDRLSVRELSGGIIIQKLSGKEVEVLCDPTLCLSKEDWLFFASKHKHKPKENYVLTYFLGEKSSSVISAIEELSKDNIIVNLNDLSHSKYYAIDPSEWVDYIADASVFLTDSFHGVVFSIIFKIPFSVYERNGGESMQTRISNILSKFQLEDRFDLSYDSPSLLKAEFGHVDAILDFEREKAYSFLQHLICE